MFEVTKASLLYSCREESDISHRLQRDNKEKIRDYPFVEKAKTTDKYSSEKHFGIEQEIKGRDE